VKHAHSTNSGVYSAVHKPVESPVHRCAAQPKIDEDPRRAHFDALLRARVLRLWPAATRLPAEDHQYRGLRVGMGLGIHRRQIGLWISLLISQWKMVTR